MFRTELIVPISQEKITLKNRILTIGSCFADSIGNRLNAFKFQTIANPFGTVYNPISIHKLLQLSVMKQTMPADSFLQRDEVYFNYNLHSSFSALQKEELSLQIQKEIDNTHYFLAATDVILLTYGTVWVYERKDTGEIVANCHKQASGFYTKRVLSQEEIVNNFSAIHSLLKSVRPNVRIILTVSPVRHLKDTLELNSVSKAILRSACYEVSKEFNNVHYFPSFEIMMDDLRDYRFYKADMLHPTDEAEEYIWEKFAHCYFDTDTLLFVKKWINIKNSLRHKAFHPTSTSHQQFLQSLYKSISELKSIVNVEEELSIVQGQLVR